MPAGPTADTETVAPDEKEKSEVGQTALLPKSILAGRDFEPGDEVVLKVTHVYENEVAVEYAKEPAKSETVPSDEDELEAMDVKET